MYKRQPLRGATVGNLNPRLGVELGLDTDVEGVVVISGRNRLLEVGDIIVAINGDEIEDVKDLQKELTQAQQRGSFDIVIERDGRQSRVVIR